MSQNSTWRADLSRARACGRGRASLESGGAAAEDPPGSTPHLRVLPSGSVDLDRATRAVSDLLDALGVERTGDHLEATPGRVARAYAELLTPEPFEATTFPNDEGYDELVVARAIPFASLCEHHLLPFSGRRPRGLPARRAARRAVEARPGRGPLRPAPPGPRAPHGPGGELHCRDIAAQGCRRGARGRAPVHVPARRPLQRVAHGDLGAQGPGARRPSNTGRVPGAGGGATEHRERRSSRRRLRHDRSRRPFRYGRHVHSSEAKIVCGRRLGTPGDTPMAVT